MVAEPWVDTFWTSDGVLQLTEGLAARLVEVLEARVREEQKQS